MTEQRIDNEDGAAAVLPPSLRRYVGVVIGAGVPVVGWALLEASRHHIGARSLLGVAMFLAFALVAELRPVPIDPDGRRNISLAFVFIISTQLLFGWQWAVVSGAVGIATAMAVDRADPIKVVFNASTYALAAALAAAQASFSGWHTGGYGGLVASVVVSGAVFVIVNVVLVCTAIALATGGSVWTIFVDHLRHSGPIFTVMVFVAAQAVIFWRLSEWLVLLLSAPIFALTMYQRSHVRSRIAEVEASTDELTSLKNRRGFEDDAVRALGEREGDARVALCLIDVDHFKQVNDRHGHPTGDALLALLAAAIEETVPRAGYRLGGDELAFLVPTEGEQAVGLVDEIRARFAAGQPALLPEPVTISAGIAVAPEHAPDGDLHSLVKNADLALYKSKNNGRSRTTVYAARGKESEHDEMLSSAFPLVDIRLVTARRLATLVDAISTASADARGLLPTPAYTSVLDRWQSFDGNHSEAVATVAVALGRRLGLSPQEIDEVRLAALLHDIGKIAVPEHVLNKPAALTDSERQLIERHPVIGYELLRDLGLSPVDTFVLHHHERWDGAGYPNGLAGPEIPFGARLILVADAFDALTSNRSYRKAISVEAAMNELQGSAGRQLDPLIVAALHDHLSETQPAAVAAERATADERAPRTEPAWSF